MSTFQRGDDLVPNDRLIKIAAVVDRVSLSRTKIYNEIKQSRFPAGTLINGSRRWRASHIDRYIAGQREWSEGKSLPNDAAG
ncbi:hypothetical protein BTW07_14550 [Salinicola socius]|uniref:AlpA family transcriptional regulator n=2 Tax=Salinicola socius TaxID=404433 RepID=A0A1Q8SPF4_9GAMM|nr:hypothetical protein BTW07_14550 [Salinicola socius]